MSQYHFKKIEFLRKGGKVSGYLVAVPHQKEKEKGFVVYFADRIEGFDPREHKKIADAFMYITPEEAFWAGELILRATHRK